MRKIFVIALTAMCAAGVYAHPGYMTAADSVGADSVKGFVFTDIKLVPTTSVKDQNKSGTCWCFAGTSFLEDEIRRQGGDSLDLSEMFTVYKCYDAKADRYVRNYGQVNFAQGGSLVDVMWAFKNFGAVPEEVYTGLNYGQDKHCHYEVEGVMKGLLDVVVKKPDGKVSTAWKRAFNGIQDAYFGPLPTEFVYKGKKYTPKSFAESLPINPDDYVAISSFTHHPFYETFVMEVPDNWLNGAYYNVPMEEMKAIVDNALENGYPVNWAADVSERGFKWMKGVALMPKGKETGDMTGTELARWTKLSDKDRQADKYNFEGPVPEETVTQESRQRGFDNQETTDDHGMEIVGIATDQEGNRYYKVKNSWDSNQVYDGFIYVSEPFFLAKTMGLVVHKDAIPKAIAKKLK